MKQIDYVRRCKNKTGKQTYKTLHASDSEYTSCGKELNEMWYVEPYDFELDEVTCKKCKKLLQSEDVAGFASVPEIMT